MEDEVVLLWGEIGVGKTSLLAAGLYSDRGRFRDVVDWAQSARTVEPQLLPVWRRLRSNRTPTGTPELKEIPLILAGGRRLTFRDVPGGWSRATERPEIGERLDQASAVLFVMEWKARERERQFDAIENVWHRLSPRAQEKAGLVFTKCEREFAAEERVWKIACEQPRGGWWRNWSKWRASEQRLLEQLPAVWPTSVYGFHETTNLPACLLDEFGELIPFQVAPRNVTEVMSWYLEGPPR